MIRQFLMAGIVAVLTVSAFLGSPFFAPSSVSLSAIAADYDYSSDYSQSKQESQTYSKSQAADDYVSDYANDATSDYTDKQTDQSKPQEKQSNQTGTSQKQYAQQEQTYPAQ
ncbi:MAG: hypothetical protein WBG63_09155 [Phormidesmis sp.]